ncbi:MAG TPA: chemotaxis protein CheX [Cellulomonas sp.]
MSAVAAEEVFAIAGDLFAAMVDGEDGTVTPWPDGVPVDEHDVAAWVDVRGPWIGRASLETSSGAACDLARALLRIPPSAPVTDDDLVDALGEVANVVGGNVKALLPDHGTLSLPQVGGALPDDGAVHPVQRVPLGWRGRSLVLTVWAADDEGEWHAAAEAVAETEDR